MLMAVPQGLRFDRDGHFSQPFPCLKLGECVEHVVIYFVRPERPFVQIVVDQPIACSQSSRVLSFELGSQLSAHLIGHTVCYKDWLVGIWVRKRFPLPVAVPGRSTALA